jgi:hypothetical protein
MQFTSKMITVKNMSSRSLHDNNDETGAEMKNKKRKMGDGWRKRRISFTDMLLICVNCCSLSENSH